MKFEILRNLGIPDEREGRNQLQAGKGDRGISDHGEELVGR